MEIEPGSMRHRRRFAFLLLCAALGCGGGGGPGLVDVPVRVGMVALDSHNVPVLVLEEQDGPRLLPIWIGMDAAHSISAEMEQQRPPRPNTHDLAKRVIQGLDGEIAGVVVTRLHEGTYYAVLKLSTRGRTVEIDARPSDAIAIALRAKAPIFVRATVFKQAGEVTIPDAYGKRIDSPQPREAQPGGTSSATPQRSL
jgi:bifunctional DNase/RNase